ncbi:MAG: hypothetical protein U9N30_09505 [Campylobacterota bacterium]|nr:hypothetical protein [Campylobacterota bacterium]
MQKNKANMKPAYIENILIWMVMFVGFVSLFFFVIDYAKIVRTIDNMDALCDYSANRISSEGKDTDLSVALNSMKVSGINTISADGAVICSDVVDGAYQVRFTITTTNITNTFFKNNLSSKRVVFNNQYISDASATNDSDSIDCNLTVTLSN